MTCVDAVSLSILQWNLVLCTAACTTALIVYYCCEEHRVNPAFANQLHCLSGMILCNRPLFSTLMCGLGGAVLLLVASRVEGMVVLVVLLMFWALVVVVQYDVREHPGVHFGALALEMGSATALLTIESIDPWFVVPVYYSITFAFLLVMALNFSWLAWTPPYMTLQALVEIAWVFVLSVCLGCLIFGDD
jgi:hypothetical protein